VHASRGVAQPSCDHAYLIPSTDRQGEGRTVIYILGCMDGLIHDSFHGTEHELHIRLTHSILFSARSMCGNKIELINPRRTRRIKYDSIINPITG
jgi:hypothetical protein